MSGRGGEALEVLRRIDVEPVAPVVGVEPVHAFGMREPPLAAGGVGLAGLALGGNFLDYFVLGADPVTGQLRGIFWVEAGVGITVAGVMLKLFTMFAARGRGAGQ